MTNEEAIELLKNGTMFMPTLQNSEYPEAFDLAIKALQKEEPQGDLISRDALRKNMEFICMGIMAGTEPYNAPLTEIDNAPTVNLEKHSFIEGYKKGCEFGKKCYDRPQGEWIVKSNGTTNYYACDKCGSAGDIQDKFCRECGADMRKGGKEE